MKIRCGREVGMFQEAQRCGEEGEDIPADLFERNAVKVDSYKSFSR